MQRVRRRASVAVGLVLGISAGCAPRSAIKPSETQDERTGVTVGALVKPIELIQSAANGPSEGRHISFAYLGPVEWDNMGTLRYGLWVHVAPGNDWRFDDIRMPGAVTLVLDDGSVVLSTMDPPELGRQPYQPEAPWGQTAYFNLDVALLRRMASSAKIELDFKAGRGPLVRFSAGRDARDSLLHYLQARGY